MALKSIWITPGGSTVFELPKTWKGIVPFTPEAAVRNGWKSTRVDDGTPETVEPVVYSKYQIYLELSKLNAWNPIMAAIEANGYKTAFDLAVTLKSTDSLFVGFLNVIEGLKASGSIDSQIDVHEILGKCVSDLN